MLVAYTLTVVTPHLRAGGDTGDSEEGGTLIFVSDASAEAERLTTALRARGYPVIDVPLGLLVSRVSVQRPALILCDADAAAALDTIQRVRELAGGNRIDVLFLGEPGRTVDEQAGALQREASGLFVRPVDELTLQRKVEALIGPPSGRREFVTRMTPANRAPVLVAATRRPYRYEAGKNETQRETPSSPSASAPRHELASSPRAVTDPGAPSTRNPELAPDSHPRSNAPSAPANSNAPRGHELPQAKLSPALESLLATAERRVLSVRHSSIPPSDRLSPEAELEAILPADVLAALDEPLDFDDDEDDSDSSVGTNNGSDAEPGTRTGTKTTGAGGASGVIVPGGGQPPPSNAARDAVAPATEPPPSGEPKSQSSRATEPPLTPPQHAGRALQSETPRKSSFDAESVPAPSRTFNGLGGATAHGPITDLPPSVRSPSERAAAVSTTPPRPRHAAHGDEPDSVAEPPRPNALREAPLPEIPASLGAGDAIRALARVVRARYTGALAFEDGAGIRRVLFRDGDFVTAASGAEGESLVEFLTQRGDMPEDVASRIGRKLPQFGRHAGAALIAQGHLRQDDLWPVLRAHAEWLVARIALLARGQVGLEADAPARLQAEPAVFGGATGAEVLVEIVRRAIAPEEAILRLGGPSALLQKGTNLALIGECALADNETDIVRSLGEEAVSEVLRRVGHQDFAAVLYVLVELAVLAVGTAERRTARGVKREPGPKPDRLDHAALRARILARKALSEEGDYFALLGVARNATGYDIRRAYSSLKDEFDPGRMLTSENLDLKEDLELIVEVLAEAYEILEDDLRRDRYRRALDASP